jgi:hypothetical protein
LRFCNLRCAWQARAGDDHFVVHLSRNVNAGEKLVEEIEAAELRQDNQRG